MTGNASWVSRLRWAISALPFPCPFPSQLDLLNATTAKELIERITHGMEQYILYQVSASPKLYLMRDRTETDARGEQTMVAMCLRLYLKRIPNRRHRVAMTGLVTSNHCFAIETLRYTDPPTPRVERKCRLCDVDVESPEHVLLACSRNERILRLRAGFLTRVLTVASREELLHLRKLDGDCLAQLKYLIFDMPDILPATAKYLYEIEAIIRGVVHPRA